MSYTASISALSQFPQLPGLAWPVTRTMMWKTQIQESISGKETRIPNYTFARYQYTMTFAVLRDAAAYLEMQNLFGFVNFVMQGALPFLYLDPNDNSVTAQRFGTGDGTTTKFQLARTLGNFVEPIQIPNTIGSNNIAIFVNGTLQTGGQAGLDNSLPGVIDFASAPANGAALTWTGQFFWLCRIDNDKTEFQQDMSGLWSLKKLTFTTIKL